ncbi:MAG: RedB protein [Planctomycetota bacterium]|nr:MAG: RedB protein [Planctomycetota bacterium]
MPTRARPSRWLVSILVPAWAITLGAGATYLSRYASQSGDAAIAPTQWPGDTGIERTDGAWTVVLAAHPRCPCTRATADELESALAGIGTPHELVVLAFQPPDNDRFADTGVIRRLGKRPDARIIPDPDARLSARFGGLTSGWVTVYDPSGALRFAGGITPTRAHTGPNTGSAAVRALLSGAPAPAPAAPVYGCPLTNDPEALLGSCSIEGEHACTP